MRLSRIRRLPYRRNTSHWPANTWLPLLTLVWLCVACGTSGPVATQPSPTATATIQVAAEGEVLEPTEQIAVATPTTARDAAPVLVEEAMRARGGYDDSVAIEVEEVSSIVDLPGLRYFKVTPQVVDVPSSWCASFDDEAYCSREALLKIVQRFTLGSNPRQLNQDEWLALVLQLTRFRPIQGPDGLDLLAGHLPGEEQAQITPPSVTWPEGGGVEITFFSEFVAYDAYPDGPMALEKILFEISPDDTLAFERIAVWEGEAAD